MVSGLGDRRQAMKQESTEELKGQSYLSQHTADDFQSHQLALQRQALPRAEVLTFDAENDQLPWQPFQNMHFRFEIRQHRVCCWNTASSGIILADTVSIIYKPLR